MPSVKNVLICALTLAASVQAIPVSTQEKAKAKAVNDIIKSAETLKVKDPLNGTHGHGIKPDMNNATGHNFWDEKPWKMAIVDGFHVNSYSQFEMKTDIPGFYLSAMCTSSHDGKGYIDKFGIKEFGKQIKANAQEAFGQATRTDYQPKWVCDEKERFACVSWSNPPDYQLSQPVIDFIVKRAMHCNPQKLGSLVQVVPAEETGLWRINVCAGDNQWCEKPMMPQRPHCNQNDMFGKKIDC